MSSTSENINALSRYSRRQRLLESLFLISFVLCSILFTQKLLGSLQSDRIALLFLALLIGITAADFVAGIVHWAADTWGTVEWPIIGPSLIRSFREHHVDQFAITRHDFIETNGASSMLCLPILLYGFSISVETSQGFLGATFILVFCVFILLTNQIHKWSHEIQTTKIISLIQKSGLIMSSAHHKIHHSYPFDQYYCITTGWLNPLLKKIRFFRFLERFISSLSGAIPRADDTRLLELKSATHSIKS